MARKFNRSTNVLSSNFSSALDRNTGVNVMQRLSDLIAQVYSEDFYKFQSNTFFALVIAQTGERATDIRTARNTFSQLEHQRIAEKKRITLPTTLYPSCKVRILETGHAFIGDPTDPNGVFNYNRLDQYADNTRPNRLKALNVAFIDMHGYPAYTNAGITPPEYGDVVLVEVDNISDPKDIKILEIVARRIIEPLGFTTEEIDPPTPDGNNAPAPSGVEEVVADQATGDLKLVEDQFDEFTALNPNPYPNISLGQTGKRKYAVQPSLLDALQAAADQSNTTIKIRSAGQPSLDYIQQYSNTFPGLPDTHRTGSARHNFGWAVDVELYSGSNRVSTNVTSASSELSDFLMAAYRNGITAIGAGPGYMTSGSYAPGWIHLDKADNNSLFSGQRGYLANYFAPLAADAPPWLINAYRQGSQSPNNNQPQASILTAPLETEVAPA